ncbi:MAG: histone deacetylase family protein, partial [Pseudomonadales bacterium]|nr:histone deacetylase family protein [Pseudomonadales bacterium]
DFSNDHIITTRLSAGDRGLAFKKAIERDWLPAIENHRPDMIFVSAGFDAHRDDPLGELELTEDDFRWVTRLIMKLANQYSKRRVVSTLEGGYNLEALALSVQAHVEELIEPQR